jgi:NADH-quinone oxidoreductase subunit L
LWLWLAGLVGALLTSIYTFRMVFVTFFGDMQLKPAGRAGWLLLGPLVALSVLAIVGGVVDVPPTLGDKPWFTDLLAPVLPPAAHVPARAADLLRLQIVAGLVSLAGIYIAWALFLRSPAAVDALVRRPALDALRRFWYAGWGFDWLYDRVFVRPVVWFAAFVRHDGIDRIYDGLAWLSRGAWRVLSATETGRIRWYAAGLTAGALIVTTVVLFL